MAKSEKSYLDYDGLVDVFKLLKTKGVEKIHWSDLKTLRDNDQLAAGTHYRIIDYQCTTTQFGTKSAGHQFDIIVTALSSNMLSEEAHACRSDNDDKFRDANHYTDNTVEAYFANCNLLAWKLWYCLDNDISRFVWADTENGKGVIYRMIDEYNNDCPYDFKNIKFTGGIDDTQDIIKEFGQLMTDVKFSLTYFPCYTFTNAEGGPSDGTVNNSYIAYHPAKTYSMSSNSGGTDKTKLITAYNNKISPCYKTRYYDVSMVNTATYMIPIIILGCNINSSSNRYEIYFERVHNVNIGADNCGIFGYKCSGLTIGSGCYNITVGQENITVPSGTSDKTYIDTGTDTNQS